ncbi:MAG: DUF1810 domain-containing protein [Clostridia bacterium]|nr:DUF1810 domain-containing protein [Clostridia bacterium]
MGKYNVERFINAQNGEFEKAFSELKNGKKQTHWIWYIFPQLRCLGRSPTAQYYGIENLEEAKAYCNNELLGGRYVQCCKVLEGLAQNNPVYIMGDIDALKLCSSLTLFYVADEKNRGLYKGLIDKFYGGKFDALTLDHLKNLE